MISLKNISKKKSIDVVWSSKHKPEISNKEIIAQTRRRKETVIQKVQFKNKNDHYVVVKDKKKATVTIFSKEARKIFKKYPEIYEFLEKNIFLKMISNKPIFLKTNDYLISLSRLKKKHGENNKGLYVIGYKDKKTGFNKKYFLKISKNIYRTNNEFLGLKKLEALGINIIKPHFAFSDVYNSNSKRQPYNVIVYDYTNLINYSDARLSKKEIRAINEKIEEASKIAFTYETNSKFKSYFGFRINDLCNPSNVYLKKISTGYEIFFADPYISYKSPGYA